MTAFLAGTLFGAIFAGALAAAICTRFQRPREFDEWEDPFADPPPLEIRTTISKRHYSL